MTKVQIKNEKITPFGGIYFVASQFKPIERAIDECLGRRCVSVDYQYGEIVIGLNLRKSRFDPNDFVANVV